MIVFNTTFVTNESTENELIDFLRGTYIPAIEEVKILHNPSLRRILLTEQQDAISLALHLEATDMDSLDEYLYRYAAGHSQLVVSRFGERVMGFSTIMEEIAHR